MTRNVLFDGTKETVADITEGMLERNKDSLMVLAPLSGNVSIHAASKTGKYKGYHRLKFEVWIPEDAIKGESALNDFGAITLLSLPKSRVSDHLKRNDDNGDN